MMKAHATLQIAWVEMLLSAMAPERACDPAMKTDWHRRYKLYVSLERMYRTKGPEERLQRRCMHRMQPTLVTNIMPKTQNPVRPAITCPASAKFITPGSTSIESANTALRSAKETYDSF